MNAKEMLDRMAVVMELVNEIGTDPRLWHTLPEDTKTAVVRVLNEYDAYKAKHEE